MPPHCLHCSCAALGLTSLNKTVCLSSDLLSHLRDARKPDGSTEHVGHILTDWVSECFSSHNTTHWKYLLLFLSLTLCSNQVSVSVSLQLPCLSSYTAYCSNQVKAKALLDQKKQDRRVQDFLQRCLQSPFSRKLDLWNFLDIPRSRLVKYPLLLREILKHTPNDHPDRQHLDEAVRKTCIKILFVHLHPAGLVYLAVRLR